MNKWKRVWNAIIHPHGGVLCLFYLVFLLMLGLVIYTLVFNPIIKPLNYILYAFTFVGLVYFVYSWIYIAPKIKFWFSNSMKKFKFTNKMITNYNFKTAVLACVGILINFGFVIFQAVLAIQTKSFWYATLTIYYLLLTLTGSVLVICQTISSTSKRKSKRFELSVYKYSGVMVLVLTLAFSIMVALTFNALYEVQFAGLMIYVTAIYVTYKLALGIHSSIKAKKKGDYFTKAIKNINLASAIISLFSLQVLLLSEFADETVNVMFFNAITGLAIMIGAISIAVYMIVKALKAKKKYLFKNNKLDDEIDKN